MCCYVVVVSWAAFVALYVVGVCGGWHTCYAVSWTSLALIAISYIIISIRTFLNTSTLQNQQW